MQQWGARSPAFFLNREYKLAKLKACYAGTYIFYLGRLSSHSGQDLDINGTVTMLSFEHPPHRSVTLSLKKGGREG